MTELMVFGIGIIIGLVIGHLFLILQTLRDILEELERR